MKTHNNLMSYLSRLSIVLPLIAVLGLVSLGPQAMGRSVGQQKPKAKPGGAFRAVYPQIRNKDYAEILAEFKKERVLESIADNLNKEISIPADIAVTFDECKEVNAFYDPQRQRLTMCFELLQHFYEIFRPDAKTEDELDDAVFGAVSCVFYHELGHALIHILDLPVTGKEEDAVDQLSTLILADGTDEGEKSVLNGARWFLLEEQQNDTDIDSLPFWDEHSLDKQRFYNLVCWLYGHDEKKYSYLIKNGVLPPERAARCPGEYEQIAKSWGKLLGPYLKD